MLQRQLGFADSAKPVDRLCNDCDGACSECLAELAKCCFAADECANGRSRKVICAGWRSDGCRIRDRPRRDANYAGVSPVAATPICSATTERPPGTSNFGVSGSATLRLPGNRGVVAGDSYVDVLRGDRPIARRNQRHTGGAEHARHVSA